MSLQIIKITKKTSQIVNTTYIMPMAFVIPYIQIKLQLRLSNSVISSITSVTRGEKSTSEVYLNYECPSVMGLQMKIGFRCPENIEQNSYVT